jgi:hypothetical protein
VLQEKHPTLGSTVANIEMEQESYDLKVPPKKSFFKDRLMGDLTKTSSPYHESIVVSSSEAQRRQAIMT